jgi:tRNA/tmRNA/rRNA uracil-C5-methylase (TrmA/RlmC/RlmD family)
VLAEQLHRLAKVDWEVRVEAVPGDDAGLGWRTRVQYSVDPSGRPGLRAHRSHEVVPVDRCRIAHPLVDGTGVTRQDWPRVDRVEVVASVGTGQTLVRPDPPSGVPVAADVTEVAAGRSWRVSGGGFWQVHPGAAEVLVGAVLEGLEPRPGEHALDLYAGVGLFAGSLAAAGCRVVAVEADRRAAADARANLADLGVRVEGGRVDRFLRRPVAHRADVVVLDPPRSGAGRRVVEEIARTRPRAVAYVACDPAALARDLAVFAGQGYPLRALRAFDIFPMTHHVEAVAVLGPAARSRTRAGAAGS